MNFDIKIVKDHDVFKLLEDQNFIAKWEEFAKDSDKVTVQQEAPFVTTWYRVYAKKYQPILILGYDKNADLIGLIPLAFSMENGYLTHAGDWQAEYKGWLCRQQVDQQFPLQALIEIKKHFHLKKWNWGWVSPRSDISWFSSKNLKNENIYVKITEEDSPLLDLQDDTLLERLKKSRSIKNKINRFKKRDNFHIARITSKADASDIFDILEKQTDFRQMAVNHVTPFASDPQKKSFLIEKLDFPQSNHFAVLWANNYPVAFNYGECDTDSVLLGVTAYDPLEGKNSPGIIFIIKLAELLKEEGFRYFDLSPGGNDYKQIFSNLTQRIYTVNIFFSKKDELIFQLRSALKKITKSSMIRLGLNPKSFMDKINYNLSILKKIKKSPVKIIERILSQVYKRELYAYYIIQTNDGSFDDFKKSEDIKVNNYSDLLLYDDSTWLHRKTDVLYEALKRFNSDDLLYTNVENGALTQYAWVARGNHTRIYGQANHSANDPKPGMILYDLYCGPGFSEKGIYDKIIQNILIDCKMDGAEFVSIQIIGNNPQLRKTIEKMGFKLDHQYVEVKFLWMSRRKMITHEA